MIPAPDLPPGLGPLARYRLHHVGLVCPGMAEAEELMGLLGLEEDYRGFVPVWSCWCLFTRPAPGGTAIELVVPEGGPLARFNKGAGGVHHFAFEVASLAEVTDWCAARGMAMISPEPVKGAGPFLCNFLNPLHSRGHQIEFVEPLPGGGRPPA